MNNSEKVSQLVNEYVLSHGTETEMTRTEFLDWINKSYSNISIANNNLYPTDLCYNSYNAGLKGFPGPNLCLIYVYQKNRFRLVGTEYKYTGDIYQYFGKKNQRLVGRWRNGVCEMTVSIPLDEDISESTLLRRDNLLDGLISETQELPVFFVKNGSDIEIRFQEALLCGVSIEENVYKIFNVSFEWNNETSYLCNQDEDGTWFYYLETIDECIGECKRFISFVFKTNINRTSDAIKHTSELSRVFTKDLFRKAYIDFIEQADKNAITKLAQGTKSVPGIKYPAGKNRISGADVIRHFGQGAASNTPYINWWVVSVYYVVEKRKIVVGIEKDRYPHLVKMHPIRFEPLGNRKTEVAIFFDTSLDDVNYEMLYESFISVSEEVMRLGLR